MSRVYWCWLCLVLASVGCKKDVASLSETRTTAELRAIKGDIEILSGQKWRSPYRRDRLSVGDTVKIPEGGLSWMRRDGGATWLIAGPAEVVLSDKEVKLSGGRAFVDTEAGDPVVVVTPAGNVELSGARASIEVAGKKATAYVLRGSARSGSAQRAQAGEMLSLSEKAIEKTPVVSWQDWTGGLATADPTAAPAPFGIGTVGARPPGDQGKPRSSLVIERLDVRVTIDRDLAFTEVDQTFVNPTSETVEGVFRFRTPLDATLSQFAVDRAGKLVWGRVKESRSAAQVYESHVYEGSTEDPALLSWESPGVYSARLYPILKGAERRVVTRYSQWLTRQGKKGERRVYVYPMAAEGAKSSLPRIEEMTVTIDVSQSGASTVRSGMGGVRKGDEIVVQAFDFVPQADLAIEMFDEGSLELSGYRAPHAIVDAEIPEGKDEDFAREVEKVEADYVAIPLRVPEAASTDEGMDLAIVIDTSAATEPAALSIGRSFAEAVLSHLGPKDRAALFAGDSGLRPVAAGSGEYSVVSEDVRRKWLAGLSSVERGGATDLGALFTAAAMTLDPKRTSAVIYVGDGLPSVGEVAPKELRQRLSRLPEKTRIIPVAIGSQPNVVLLDTVARGASVQVVEDAYGAARSALHILEAVARPTWIGAKVDLGPGVDRVLPEVLPPLAPGETVMIVGRRTGKLPSEVIVKGSQGDSRYPVHFDRIEDRGDLRRRWGSIRLQALMDEGAGRATLVELSERYGLVSPFTSLYVPTRAEEVEEDYVDEADSYEERQARLLRWKPWARDSSLATTANQEPPLENVSVMVVQQYMEEEADNREGGTGTRAKGDEGSTDEAAPGENKRYAVKGPSDGAGSHAARLEALRNSDEFGMIGHAKEEAPPQPEPVEMAAAPASKSIPSSIPARRRGRDDKPSPKPASPPCPPDDPMCGGLHPAPEEERGAAGNMWGDGIHAEDAKGGLGLSGTGEAGGGTSEGLELGTIGTIGTGRGIGTDREGSSHGAARNRAIGFIGHRPIPCGKAADLPLAERQTLWRERLAGSGVSRAVDVYSEALRACEAANWRERVALLVMMVDNLPDVVSRVQLWRMLLRVSPGAADAVYRFLVLRVKTAEQLRQLHVALGFEQVDPDVLRSLLDRTKDPRSRLTELRGVAEKFPDDSELALRVLEAYEDAEDEAGGRAWARKLRRRPDATSHLRTSVGEYYLRLSERGGPSAERDEAEGRRTFGEIVEFAPEDPLARRHLGDLLSSHGWHDDAERQYETLERLTPDDPTVKLLLARAAQGTGKTERAVRLAEQAAGTSAPDSIQPVSVAAYALSSVFLAEARLTLGGKKNADELARLRGRAARLAAKRSRAGHRVILTWSHPELRPALWTNALGSLMPAADNLPLLGIAEAYVPMSPEPRIEVRLDEQDAQVAARLGLTAELFVIEREGEDAEIVHRVTVGFSDEAGHPQENAAFELSEGRLQEIER